MRSRLKALVGSVLFLAVAPGVVAGLVPWWMTGWEVRRPLPYGLAVQLVGALLVAGGALVLLEAFARFVLEGVGTPAPVAPTEHLVVGGSYRYVRNPMYLAVAALILGQALLLGHAGLLLYLGAFLVAVVTFVRFYEEPTLRRRYGAQYERYRQAVPAWWPRLRPWRPPEAPPTPRKPKG